MSISSFVRDLENQNVNLVSSNNRLKECLLKFKQECLSLRSFQQQTREEVIKDLVSAKIEMDKGYAILLDEFVIKEKQMKSVKTLWREGYTAIQELNTILTLESMPFQSNTIPPSSTATTTPPLTEEEKERKCVLSGRPDTNANHQCQVIYRYKPEYEEYFKKKWTDTPSYTDGFKQYVCKYCYLEAHQIESTHRKKQPCVLFDFLDGDKHDVYGSSITYYYTQEKRDWFYRNYKQDENYPLPDYDPDKKQILCSDCHGTWKWDPIRRGKKRKSESI